MRQLQAIVFVLVAALIGAALAQPPKAPPYPPLNLAVAKLAQTATDLGSPAVALAFSEGKKSLIVACEDGTLHVWPQSEGKDLLAADVKLDLVNRLQLEGRDKIGLYFTRYAEETKWRFALGAIEGRPAMLVFDSTGMAERPAHFVLIDWSESRIIGIRDFLFAPYVLESIDWVRLGQIVQYQRGMTAQ